MKAMNRVCSRCFLLACSAFPVLAVLPALAEDAPRPKTEPITATPAESRAAVPVQSALAAAEKQIKDTFKEDYQKRTSAERLQLAQKLLKIAHETKDDNAFRYVALREAKDIAAAAGDLPTASIAADLLAWSYVEDAAELRAATLVAASRSFTTPDAAAKGFAAALALVDQFLKDDRLEQAPKLASLLEDMARRANNAEWAALAKARSQEVRASQAEWVRIKPAKDRLKANPNDSDAITLVGKYHGARGAWDDALPLLAKCSVAALKDAAAADLAKPEGAPECADLGDLWWSIAEKEQGSFKAGSQARASYWYGLALSRLSGVRKLLAEKRMQSAMATASGSGIPVTLHWTIADDADVYLNGKPLRQYTPDFHRRGDEAYMAFEAAVALKTGDVITVGGRRGGSYGITLFALTKDGRLVFKTDTTHWKVYVPGPEDAQKWYLPAVPLRSQTMPVAVQPLPFPTHRTLTEAHKVKVECIWDKPTAQTAFLYAVVDLAR
jgi:hypothetical protein